MYGTTTSYGSQVDGATDSVDHVATLTGLACGTSYHYRAVSSTPEGAVVSSADEVVTTGACIIF